MKFCNTVLSAFVVVAVSLSAAPGVDGCASTNAQCVLPGGINVATPAYKSLLDSAPYLGAKVLVDPKWKKVDIDFHLCAGCAGFTNDLDVYLDTSGTTSFVFNNKQTLDTVVTKTGIVPDPTDGEIKLEMDVINTGDKFFTGPGSRNPDNIEHASVVAQPSLDSGRCITVYVGWEDLFGGGDRDFADLGFSMTICPTEIEVDVDVQPGDDVGCLNVNGNGKIPAAVLGSSTLDVNDIDQATLEFQGLNVAVKGQDKIQCAFEDVNYDGIIDLICQYEDDTANWSVVEHDTGNVSGYLLDGVLFKGSDVVCVVDQPLTRHLRSSRAQ